MAGVKVTGFKGISPRTAPELLPDQNGQIARNTKIYSGDLIPYPQPVIAGMTGQSDTVLALHPLRDPDTNEIVWMSWTSDVNVATPSAAQRGDDQRFFYTGDGVPKVSTYDLAVDGSGGPYPATWYALGLPLPDTSLSATAAEFTQLTVGSYSRDNASTATINTTTNHGLRTGTSVAITGFTFISGTYSRSGTTVTATITNHGLSVGATVYISITDGAGSDGAYTISSVANANTFTYSETETGSTSGTLRVDFRNFNTPSSVVTVVDENTFTYFSPGFSVSNSTGGGKVDLSGQPALRTYVYTWYTPWGEESIASEPSDDVIAREGQTITITDIPQAPPTTTDLNFIRGVRVYRTLASNNVGEYYQLKTLWFPQATASMSRSGGLTTMTMEEPHNFIEGDRFKITGCTDTSFNATDAVVEDIIDDFTFTFFQAGGDVTETIDTGGLLFHDAAESKEFDARYWGLTSYDFTDDFLPSRLVDKLESDSYVPPPENLAGLKVIQNNILAGFVGRRLLFSEPDFPHAWPEEYEITLDDNIVAIEAVSGIGMVALTEGYPYLISGSDPTSMQVQRIDALYPCLNPRSVVPMNFGIVWATHGGLATYSPSSGPKMLTETIFQEDTWNERYDPESFVATFYDGAYFASHSTGSIVVRLDNQMVQFVDCDEQFDAVCNDKITSNIYYTKDELGNVYQWDDVTQPMQTQEWKTKKLITPNYINLGAARVVADYGSGELPLWEEWDTDWDEETIAWNSGGGVTFSMWVEGDLVFEEEITSKLPFRLPTGYRSDTFEFSVSGDIRIRAIHLAETPIGLKEA